MGLCGMLTFPEAPFQCLFTLAYKELKPFRKKKKEKQALFAECPDAAVSISGPSWSGFTMKNVLLFGNGSAQREMFALALIKSVPQTSTCFH